MEGLSSKMIGLIITMHEKKKITRTNSGIPTLSYYVWTNVLKEKNIITLDGINEKNQHQYILTPKGKRVAELLVELKSILNEDNN